MSYLCAIEWLPSSESYKVVMTRAPGNTADCFVKVEEHDGISVVVPLPGPELIDGVACDLKILMRAIVAFDRARQATLLAHTG